MDDNSLGERRDLLLKQAEQLEKQRLAQSELDSETSSNFGSGRISQSPKMSSENDSIAGTTEIEKDYAEDEEENWLKFDKNFETKNRNLTKISKQKIEI